MKPPPQHHQQSKAEYAFQGADDAAVVVVPAPERELLPEEIEVLKTYVNGGGALLVYTDPGRNPMTGLMDHIGIDIGEDHKELVPELDQIIRLEHRHRCARHLWFHSPDAQFLRVRTRFLVCAGLPVKCR